jgi:hypothetical protein
MLQRNLFLASRNSDSQTAEFALSSHLPSEGKGHTFESCRGRHLCDFVRGRVTATHEIQRRRLLVSGAKLGLATVVATRMTKAAARSAKCLGCSWDVTALGS